MRDEDFCCAVCLDYFVEPAIIECGHSYCFLCIESHLNIHETCPLCRAHAQNPIRNRQLESITMSYVTAQKQGDEYHERMKLNERKRLLQKRAQVIIYTILEKQPGRSTTMCNIINNVADEELKAEIIRQIWQQDGIGLETEGDLQGSSAIIRLRSEKSSDDHTA